MEIFPGIPMPMGKDVFFMYSLVVSIALALTVHWFAGLAHFMISYGYILGE